MLKVPSHIKLFYMRLKKDGFQLYFGLQDFLEPQMEFITQDKIAGNSFLDTMNFMIGLSA